jgi:hypothetical protein
MIVHEGTAHLQGLAHGTELTRAVAGHDNGIGIVVALRHNMAEEERTKNY